MILNREFDRLYHSNASQYEATIILFDLDNFKFVNDHYGHLNGDKVLIELVQLFQPWMNEKSLLVRWGGEEFMVYQKNSNIQEAQALAEKLKEVLAQYVFEIGLKITCSFGVVSSKECENLDELLNKVDARMYQAKKLGKNRIIST